MADSFVRSTNLNAIRSRVNAVYGRPSRSTASYSTTTPLINSAISEVVNRFWVFAEGWATLTTTADTDEYTPPPLMQHARLLGAQWAESTTNPKSTLTVRSQEWFDTYRPHWRWSTSSGTPTDVIFDRIKNKIRLYPIPSTSSWTMELWYVRRAIQFELSTDADNDGIVLSTSIQAANTAKTPDGADASSGVVTYTNPHPVYVASSSAPTNAVTFTITGTDVDGDSTTDTIVLGTSATSAHGTVQFRTITSVAWTAAGNAITATVGDYDQTDSASTQYCDIPDDYIVPLLTPVVCEMLAWEDVDKEAADYFRAAYERKAEIAMRELQPMFDAWGFGGEDRHFPNVLRSRNPL